MTNKYTFRITRSEIADAVIYAEDLDEALRMVEDKMPDELHFYDASPNCDVELVSVTCCDHDDALQMISDLMYLPRTEMSDEVYLKLKRIKDCLKGDRKDA